MTYKYKDVEGRLVDMCRDEGLSYEKLALACLAFMSEDQIGKMAEAEELIDFDQDSDEIYYDVSIVRENGGHTFLKRFDEDEADKSPLEAAETFADNHSGDYNVEVVVEKVTDNGGWREEVAIYAPVHER